MANFKVPTWALLPRLGPVHDGPALFLSTTSSEARHCHDKRHSSSGRPVRHLTRISQGQAQNMLSVISTDDGTGTIALTIPPRRRSAAMTRIRNLVLLQQLTSSFARLETN